MCLRNMAIKQTVATKEQLKESTKILVAHLPYDEDTSINVPSEVIAKELGVLVNSASDKTIQDLVYFLSEEKIEALKKGLSLYN